MLAIFSLIHRIFLPPAGRWNPYCVSSFPYAVQSKTPETEDLKRKKRDATRRNESIHAPRFLTPPSNEE